MKAEETMNINLVDDFQKDIENISRINIVSTILDVVCKTTGMGFAAVARVTENTWMACAVKDDIAFGLKPGDELKIKTTICNEIRASGKAVIIDHVSEDADFKDHHTPAMYGFQSYISMPIVRKDGTFFGTLCAIDPQPNELKKVSVSGMFALFSDLISFHLDAIEHLNTTETKLIDAGAFNEVLEKKIMERTLELEEKNNALVKMNKDLQAFTYISSHDLQEPLRKIQTFANLISEKELDNLSQRGRDYFKRLFDAAERMQALINDLLTYSHTEMDERKPEVCDMQEITHEVIEEMSDMLKLNQATVEVKDMCKCKIIQFQFKQLLQNIFNNSLKYASPGRAPHIIIESHVVSRNSLANHKLPDKFENYCHIIISDNGIGFDPVYNEKVFGLFQRLHDRSNYQGTGIGLAIVKKIVENHHGVITASGEPGVGAKFDIYLPA